MSRWFAPDSPLMRAMRIFADIVHLNLMIIITSLPLITVGASLSAAYATARGELNDLGGGLTVRYLREFRRNLARCSMLWLLLAVAGVALLALWRAVPVLPVRMLLSLCAALWTTVFLWTWPLQARFDNGVAGTLRTALLVGMAHLPRTVLMLGEVVVYVALLIMACRLLPQALFLLLVTGVGLLVFLHIGPTEHAFAPLVARTAPVSTQ